MALKTIKNKIRSVDKTRKVTKAMEAVSAVKMRKSQERARDGRAYARSALTILERVSGSFEGLSHPLALSREVRRACIVVVTSDKGLAGNLNNAVLKKATALVGELNLARDEYRLICLGRKAKDHFTKRDYSIVANYENLSDAIQIADMRDITKIVIDNFSAGEFDVCYIVYTNFQSTFEQEAVVRKVLPISLEAISEMVTGILPTKGKFSEGAQQEEAPVQTYSVEPNPEEVLLELIPFLVNIEMYHVLLEAKASEHSARMVAMKNASDKALEMSKSLNLEFNKERQALITREVSEIIGGMETLG